VERVQLLDQDRGLLLDVVGGLRVRVGLGAVVDGDGRMLVPLHLADLLRRRVVGVLVALDLGRRVEVVAVAHDRLDGTDLLLVRPVDQRGRALHLHAPLDRVVGRPGLVLRERIDEHHRVLVLGVLEEVVDAGLLEQPAHEGEVGLVVLHAVVELGVDGLVVETPLAVGAVGLEDVGDHVWNTRLSLPRVANHSHGRSTAV